MKEQHIINLIKSRFYEVGNPAQVPLLKGGSSFRAELSSDGIYVDNLGILPLLRWEVFTEAVSLLKSNGGRAKRGDAMNSRLGDKDLPLNSVEGHITKSVYGYEEGDWVFRRITPIACILIWAKICDHKPGELLISDNI